jgi:hypothetical protein
MTAKLTISLAAGLSIVALSPAWGGDIGSSATTYSSSTNAPSSALPGDPFSDPIPTNKFDPQPVSSPFDRSGDSAEQQQGGIDQQQQSAGNTGGASFKWTPSADAQSGPAGALAPLSNRVGSRLGNRLSSRINNQWGGKEDRAPDPRDSYNNAAPSDPLTGFQNAYDNAR